MIFKEKYFSCYILLTDRTVLLSDCLYFLIYCPIVYCNCFFPCCKVINFEINLIFLIKSFYYTNKKLTQKFKYLQNENNFLGEIKSIFVIFKELSFAKNYLRPERGPLILFLQDLLPDLWKGKFATILRFLILFW